VSEKEKTARRLVDHINNDDPIVKYGNPILREKCKFVTSFTDEIPELAVQMEKIMHDANGCGLAAPQVGILQRIFIYDTGDGMRAVVNPKITRSKGEQVGVEGCLSLPGLQGDVARAFDIVVKGQDEFGKPIKIHAEEFEARVIQHEIDHLDGILFIDEGRADPETLHWLTAEETAEEAADGSLEKIQE
jgi:peptide deformylase